MWLEYYKLIRSALTRYESNRISLIEKSPVWRAELYFEIRAKALECAAKNNSFNPSAAFKAANEIKQQFINSICSRNSIKKNSAPLDVYDNDKIQQIETLYILGGANLVCETIKFTLERPKVAKLLSMAFGNRPKPGEKKDSNSIKYTKERMRFKALLQEGYTVRTSSRGSVYMEKEWKKVRFSQHTGLNELLYKDIDEFFNIF